MKLVGERRALASIVFAFFFLAYLVSGIMGDAGMSRVAFGIAGVYGLAFFSLVAGYFWARWYAVGVGLFGVIIAAVAWWQQGLDYPVMFLGGAHLLATLSLWGASMSEGYDGQQAWRQRYHMDEGAVQRLGRSVIRAGVSLPFVLVYALAPRGAAAMIGGLGALVLAGLGLRALVRMRTWGIVAVGAAGAVMISLATVQLAAGHDMIALKPALAGGLLFSAAMPWLAPIVRTLRGS